MPIASSVAAAATTSGLPDWVPSWIAPSVWHFLDQLSPIANVFSIASPFLPVLESLAIAIVAPVIYLMRRRHRNDGALIALLKRDKARLEAELSEEAQKRAQIETKFNELNARLPESLMKQYKEMWGRGDFETAYDTLNCWLDLEGPRVSEVLIAVTRSTLGRSVGEMRRPGLSVSWIYLTAAASLSPFDDDCRDLAKDINSLMHLEGQGGMRFREALTLIRNASSAHAINTESVTAAMAAMRQAEDLIASGHFQVALLVVRLAESQFVQNLGSCASYTVACRRMYGVLLYHVGKYEDALHIFEAIEASFDGQATPEDLAPVLLEIGYQRAQTMIALGRSRDALVTINSVISEQVENFHVGPTHTSTIASKKLLANILRTLGRYSDALAVMDGLLGMHISDDSLALTLRHEYAGILYELARFDEALIALDHCERNYALLDSDRQATSILIPFHDLKAKTLLGLGRNEEALKLAQENIRILEADENFGPESSLMLPARSMMARTLSKTGQHEQALVIVNDILQRRADAGANDTTSHTDSLSKYLKADILLALGRYEEALPVIEEARDWFIRDENHGPDHLTTLLLSKLKASALLPLERIDEALALIDDVVGKLVGNSDLSANHPDITSALHLQTQLVKARTKKAGTVT
jgi:tetratricopeptide (TPR) repeat protein